MNSLPTDILEERAAEQRRRIHNSVAELRMSVREKLDWKKNVNEYSRQYFVPAAGAVAVIGLAMGYGFGGMFK